MDLFLKIMLANYTKKYILTLDLKNKNNTNHRQHTIINVKIHYIKIIVYICMLNAAPQVYV